MSVIPNPVPATLTPQPVPPLMALPDPAGPPKLPDAKAIQVKRLPKAPPPPVYTPVPSYPALSLYMPDVFRPYETPTPVFPNTKPETAKGKASSPTADVKSPAGGNSATAKAFMPRQISALKPDDIRQNLFADSELNVEDQVMSLPWSSDNAVNPFEKVGLSG